jgi:hypothetical protein
MRRNAKTLRSFCEVSGIWIAWYRLPGRCGSRRHHICRNAIEEQAGKEKEGSVTHGITPARSIEKYCDGSGIA